MKNRLAALLALTIVAVLTPHAVAQAVDSFYVTGTVVSESGQVTGGTVSLAEWGENGPEPIGTEASIGSDGQFTLSVEPGWQTVLVDVETVDGDGVTFSSRFSQGFEAAPGESPVLTVPVKAVHVRVNEVGADPVLAQAEVWCDEEQGDGDPGPRWQHSSSSGSGTELLTLYIMDVDASCFVYIAAENLTKISQFTAYRFDDAPRVDVNMDSRPLSGSVRLLGGSVTPTDISLQNDAGVQGYGEVAPDGSFSTSAPVGPGTIFTQVNGPGYRVTASARLTGTEDTVDLELQAVPLRLEIVGDDELEPLRVELMCFRSGDNAARVEQTRTGQSLAFDALPTSPDTTCHLSMPFDGGGQANHLVTVGADGAELTYFRESGALIHGDPDEAVDDDGVDAQTEALGPNSGDGNLDGIFDYRQDNVATLPPNGQAASPSGSAAFLTVVGPDGATLSGVSTQDPADLPTAPPSGATLSAGLVSFTLEGVTPGSTQTVRLYARYVASATDYAKYDPATQTWTFLPDDRVAIFRDYAEITLTDGGIGDADGFANGRIVDPGGPAEVTTPPDTTPPEVTGTATTEPNSNGWYDDDVTITWTATDDTSPVTDPADTVLTEEGDDLTATSEPVCDAAGNCTTGSVSGIAIDRTPPTVQLTGPADGSAYVVGGVPSVTCTASDVLSGLAAPCATTTTGGRSNGVGAFLSTASATDLAGHTSQAAADYDVHYGFDGFQQPINDPRTSPSTVPTSVFRAGDTVPVAFTLRRANGSVITPADAPRWVTPTRGAATTARVNENVPSKPGSTGATFTWKKDHWQYDWSTKKLTPGYEYRIGAQLDDGTTRYVTVALR